MAKVNTYKDLIVWQKAMEMTIALYQIVKKLPKEETYALSDQMRRAAISIPSNMRKVLAEILKRSISSFCLLPMALYVSWKRN